MSPPDRIEHPAAWLGRDMAASPDRWSEVLDPADIAELQAAADRFLSTVGDIGGVTAETFPLPRLGPRLRELRETLLQGVGFRLLRGWPTEAMSLEQTAAVFCGIGAHIGVARSQNAAGHVLGHVRDVGADIDDPTVRIYQTTQRQTFHTDSTDAVGLLCLNEAMEGGASLLVSTLTLYNEMRLRHPDLAPLLFDPVATDRRSEVPEGQNPWFEIPVLSWHEGRLTGLYHGEYIRSAARFKDAPVLSDAHREALDRWDDLANDPALHLRMRLQAGDMQFVYNHHLLHDRTAFRDWSDPARRRHLLRLWLSLPGDRPLPPIFAERYGSIEIGNRGGIITKGTKLHATLTP